MDKSNGSAFASERRAQRLKRRRACGRGGVYSVPRLKNYFAGWLAYQDARPSIMALL